MEMLFLNSTGWLGTAEGILSLIGGLVGILAGIPSVIFAIWALIKSFKGKNAQAIWEAIKIATDAAMKTVEAQGGAGADKKKLVIETVKATLKSQGVDISAFLDQLSAYIDECIAFANERQKNKELANSKK